MTPDDLSDRADQETERQRTFPERIHCCTAAGCQSCGGEAVKAALTKAVKDQKLEAKVEIVGTGCMGLCSKGPLVRRQSDDALYHEVSAHDAPALLDAAVKSPALEKKRLDLNHPFFAGQLKIVLENAGRVDPERVESYIAAGGYAMSTPSAWSRTSPPEATRPSPRSSPP